MFTHEFHVVYLSMLQKAKGFKHGCSIKMEEALHNFYCHKSKFGSIAKKVFIFPTIAYRRMFFQASDLYLLPRLP